MAATEKVLEALTARDIKIVIFLMNCRKLPSRKRALLKSVGCKISRAYTKNKGLLVEIGRQIPEYRDGTVEAGVLGQVVGKTPLLGGAVP